MGKNVDLRQLLQFRGRLEECIDELPILSERLIKDMAKAMIAGVKQRTPVGVYPAETGIMGGTLRRNWTTANFKKNGVNVKIDVINPTEYAIYVEYGHRQQKGRYVPAIGKRLKKGWVEGRFMLTKTEQDLGEKFPLYVEKELTKWLERKLNNG